MRNSLPESGLAAPSTVGWFGHSELGWGGMEAQACPTRTGSQDSPAPAHPHPCPRRAAGAKPGSTRLIHHVAVGSQVSLALRDSNNCIFPANSFGSRCIWDAKNVHPVPHSCFQIQSCCAAQCSASPPATQHQTKQKCQKTTPKKSRPEGPNFAEATVRLIFGVAVGVQNNVPPNLRRGKSWEGKIRVGRSKN